jgi:DnaJ like chaperone protein
MNYWGKIIGMVSGLALGGPEGSLVGVLAGHAVDVYTAWAERRTVPDHNLESERRNPSARYNFTLAVVTLGAKLAKSDGPVTKAEIAAFKDVFRVPPEEVGNVGRLFDRARQSATGYEPYAEQLAVMFEDNHAMLDDLIGCLFHVAIADGTIKVEEADFIHRVCRIFGFSESYFQRRLEENTGFTYYNQANGQPHGRQGQHRTQQNHGQQQGKDYRRPADPTLDAYRMLGLTSAATEKEIKAKYRRLVRENHPDSLLAAGKSKELVTQATDKLARINAAYDVISKERNIN